MWETVIKDLNEMNKNDILVNHLTIDYERFNTGKNDDGPPARSLLQQPSMDEPHMRPERSMSDEKIKDIKTKRAMVVSRKSQKVTEKTATRFDLKDLQKRQKRKAFTPQNQSRKVNSRDETLLQGLFAKLKKKNDNYIVPHDELGRGNSDILPMYYMDETTVLEYDVQNNDNNGKLFINGLPFWCVKEEVPKIVSPSFTSIIKSVLEKKLKLLKEQPKPTVLDPFAELESLQARDNEFFNKDKRLLTNTVRALVGCSQVFVAPNNNTTANLNTTNNMTSLMMNSKDSKDSREREDDDVSRSSMTFVIPQRITMYNRRNRFDRYDNSFVPGKKKKSIIPLFKIIMNL